MKIEELLKTWVLPDRTADRAQITLRLSFNDYARLHALKEIYKNRSVNDMINDILKVGLDEIIEALPDYKERTPDDVCHMLAAEHGGKPSDYEYSNVGPRIDFDNAYKKILETKPEKDSL
jgi:hypothetical protein